MLSLPQRICLIAFLALFVTGGVYVIAQEEKTVEPEQLVFKDDGTFPNNALPLLLYPQALAPDIQDLPAVFEQRFAANDWTGSWRYGVYTFPHYHSTTQMKLPEDVRSWFTRTLHQWVQLRMPRSS